MGFNSSREADLTHSTVWGLQRKKLDPPVTSTVSGFKLTDDAFPDVSLMQ